MRLTRHNGRSGKDGVYTARHNDRQFGLENAGNVDASRTADNLYWDRVDGFYQRAPGENLPEGRMTFEEVEDMYYSAVFRDYIEGQNARNAITRHVERNRTTDDLRKDGKTCPEETIYQIGSVDDGSVSGETLAVIVAEFLNEFDRLFGEHVKILDMALHMDEATPHIHERHVFQCENGHGEIAPKQEKALEALGFDLPHPDRKMGRTNNRKMAFDATCRTLLFDICRKHGLELEGEPDPRGWSHLEKLDYIASKQEKKIAEGEVRIGAQEKRMEELAMRIDDVEKLIEEVSETAYDKAVDVVTDLICEETQKEDVRILAGAQKRELALDREGQDSRHRYAAAVLGRAAQTIRQNAQRIMADVRARLSTPDRRAEGIEEVKEKARESVLRKLKAAQDGATDREQKGRTIERER